LTFSDDFLVTPAGASAGSRVTVTGHGLPAATAVRMCQTPDGWNDALLCPTTSEVAIVDTDQNGNLNTTLRADRYLVHHEFVPLIGRYATILFDCAIELCVAGADLPGDGVERRWPVLLAPIPPPPAQRGAIEVSPTTGLQPGSGVHVAGSGFRPSAWIDVLQCRPTIDNIADCNPPTRVQADATGSFVTDAVVSDRVGPSSQFADNPYDCAFAPNRCLIAAAEEVDFEHTVVSQPIEVVVTPTIRLFNGSAAESDPAVSWPVVLSRAVRVPVTVQWSTVVVGDTGEATAGEDYQPASGTITFAPGTTQVSASVPLLEDTIDEPTEHIYVQLSSPVNGVIQGSDLMTAALHDNDPQPLVQPVNESVVEGNTGSKRVDVGFTLSNPSSRTVTATWRTVTPSPLFAPPAQAGFDFDPANGTLTFPPGTTTQHATVTVHGDVDPEADERFGISLGVPTNATIAKGFGHVAWVHILDDDPTATLLPGLGSVPEGSAGTVELPVPFSLSDPFATPVTVDWQSRFVTGGAGAQAEPPADYASGTGTVVLEPGETNGSAVIVVNGDTAPEPDEYVLVTFTSPTPGIRVGGAFGIGGGVITNDD
jgi:hypothetical protein